MPKLATSKLILRTFQPASTMPQLYNDSDITLLSSQWLWCVGRGAWASKAALISTAIDPRPSAFIPQVSPPRLFPSGYLLGHLCCLRYYLNSKVGFLSFFFFSRTLKAPSDAGVKILTFWLQQNRLSSGQPKIAFLTGPNLDFFACLRLSQHPFV